MWSMSKLKKSRKKKTIKVVKVKASRKMTKKMSKELLIRMNRVKENRNRSKAKARMKMLSCTSLGLNHYCKSNKKRRLRPNNKANTLPPKCQQFFPKKIRKRGVKKFNNRDERLSSWENIEVIWRIRVIRLRKRVWAINLLRKWTRNLPRGPNMSWVTWCDSQRQRSKKCGKRAWSDATNEATHFMMISRISRLFGKSSVRKKMSPPSSQRSWRGLRVNSLKKAGRKERCSDSIIDLINWNIYVTGSSLSTDVDAIAESVVVSLKIDLST